MFHLHCRLCLGRAFPGSHKVSHCICLCIFVSVYVFVFFYLYIYLYLSFFICICICQCLGRAVPGSHKVSPPTAVEGHCRLFLVVHLDAPTNHHPPTHWPPQPPYPDMENVANMENICVQFFSSCAFRCSHHPPTAPPHIQTWKALQISMYKLGGSG